MKNASRLRCVANYKWGNQKAVSEDPQTTKMDLSGGSASVMLDHLGPIVVGTDGSLSRIANYEKMSEIEKKNTLRIISKRNNERLEALKSLRESSQKTE